MQFRSLGWEYPLEEGTATHSNILAWRIPWTEKPGRLQSTGDSRGVGQDLAHTQFGQMQRKWNSSRKSDLFGQQAFSI